MLAPATCGLRRALAMALILVLTLSGVGRAAAFAARPAEAGPIIGGVAVPICHTGSPRDPAGPGDPAAHACCDACALLAPAVLPVAPAAIRHAPSGDPVERVQAAAGNPILARPRSPRQSRGPPAA